MFDHVTIRVADRAASEAFYATVLEPLGIEATYSDARFAEWDDFSLTVADAEHPVTRGLHIGFGARSRELVEAFWRAGRQAGHRDDGAPGPRPQYRDDYFGGFLLDPDGNSAEAVHHAEIRPPGHIDHLWIRVADVPVAAAFYDLVAPYGGFERKGNEPDHAHFVGAGGSFSLVPGRPTENLHVAFPATENAAVDAFHRAAIEAGYRDNGAPGERPRYHPGYYGAYVLDPDGNNIELVNHNR
ncbi:MAG TPA: VOC family protein [Solirubrobacteraceae bacterium]|jgi:catechol 2,3-dioxygenase-like lactoylglutathione lyase family enzyme